MILRLKLKTDQEKYDSTCHWHSWWAWRPVLFGKELAWLETIERRRILVGGHETFFSWDYRVKEFK